MNITLHLIHKATELTPRNHTKPSSLQNIGLAIGTATTSIADAILGLSAQFGVFATGGKNQKIWKFAQNHTEGFGNLIACPFAHLVCSLNQDCSFATILFEQNGITKKSDTFDGFIASTARSCFQKLAEKSLKPENRFFTRHVVSRVLFSLMLITSVITRIVDAIIGVLAGIAALITLGKISRLSMIAFRALHAPNLIKDLFYCSAKMINPWAGIKKKSVN